MLYIADRFLFIVEYMTKGCDTMAYTEAQKRANLKYMKEKTDDIRLRVPKGTKDRYRSAAARYGVSMTQFVLTAVEEKIEREAKEIPNAETLAAMKEVEEMVSTGGGQRFSGSTEDFTAMLLAEDD